MSEKKRFFKSGILLTLVALSMRTVGILFASYITGCVGAEGMGLYTLIMTVYSFAVTVATSGISLTVTQLTASAVGEGREDSVSGIIRSCLLYSLIFGLGASLLLYLCAGGIAAGLLDDNRAADCLRALSFSLAPTAFSAVFSGYFIGVKRVGFNAGATVFSQAVRIFLTVLLMGVLSKDSAEAAVGGICIAVSLSEWLGCILMVLEYLYDRRGRHRSAQLTGGQMRRVVSIALPLALSAYVRALLLNAEHILIPKKLRESGESPDEAYAHYGTLHGMALPIVIYPMTPLSSFAGLLVPEFAEDRSAGRTERMSKVASDAINATLAYSVLCSVFLFAFAEELGYAVYRSYDAGYYISVLAICVPIMYLDHVTDSMLKGFGEQVYSMWVNISDSLLSVFLVWTLIPRMGIMGYALVIVIMEGYNFLLSFIRLRKRVSFRIRPIDSIVIPLSASAVGIMITVGAFQSLGSSSTLFLILLKLVFALAITVAAYNLFLIVNSLLQSRRKKKDSKQPKAA